MTTQEPSPVDLSNRLAEEGSLYLRQHARQQIAWQPWDDRALEAARRLDRPLFVSVGYSSCHWCHVMEREAFSSPTIAELLNRAFVPVKVDREERPDVDAACMAALVGLTGQGGWPTSLFLTPDLHPFYAATYVPEAAFRELLGRIAAAWRGDRDRLVTSALEVSEALARQPAQGADRDGRPTRDSAAALLALADLRWGGLRGPMKFPMAPLWSYLLHAGRREAGGRVEQAVRLTLDRMADGGIHDHVGGGFHRYSVDPAWHVPHFEKMLSDNALLAGLYTEAAATFPGSGYGAVARGALEFLLAEMRLPSGGFATSLDADDPGGEGAYYTWAYDEILSAGGGDGPVLADLLGATRRGVLDGRNVLTRRADREALGRARGLSAEGLLEIERAGLGALARIRAGRAGPALDTKVLTGWNGLAIAALARGARVLGEPRYEKAAEACARYLRAAHVEPEGGLVRATNDGRPSGVAMLEDYAYLAAGLLELIQCQGAGEWLPWVRLLLDGARSRFRAPSGAWSDGPAGAAPLPFSAGGTDGDGVLPAPLAVLAGSLHWLGLLEADEGLCEEAEAMARGAATGPEAVSWADLVLRWAAPACTVAVEGGEAAGTLYRAAARLGLDSAFVYPAAPSSGATPGARVCRRGACLAPVTDPDELVTLLASPSARSANRGGAAAPGDDGSESASRAPDA